MRQYVNVALITAVLTTGCGLEEAIRKKDDRYAEPGALDSPLTGIYSKYAYRFMGRYQVTHEWVNTAACSYRSSELPNLPNGKRTNSYAVPEIYEMEGRTWQASSVGLNPREFDTKVRSVTWISRAKGKEGQAIEIGYQPLCFESWWNTSHYLRVRMQKRSLAEFEAVAIPRAIGAMSRSTDCAGGFKPCHWRS